MCDSFVNSRSYMNSSLSLKIVCSSNCCVMKLLNTKFDIAPSSKFFLLLVFHYFQQIEVSHCICFHLLLLLSSNPHWYLSHTISLWSFLFHAITLQSVFPSPFLYIPKIYINFYIFTITFSSCIFIAGALLLLESCTMRWPWQQKSL